MTEQVVESYPLTPTQQGILFNSLRAGSGMVEIEQIVGRLHHPLDVPQLRAAWAWAEARHAALRTSFRWDGGEARQQVVARAPIPFEQRDHSRLAEAARDAELARFLEEDRERGFDLAKPPLARLTLFVYRGNDVEPTGADADAPSSVLVWTFHHALLDGRSFTQVLREVFDRYDAELRGEVFDPPAPPPFRRHCEHLHAQTEAQRAKERAGETHADAAFWTEHLRGFSTPTPVPAARTIRGPAARRRHDELETRVGAATVKRLIDLGREHGFTLASAVQGAWAIALARYARTDDVCFGSTRAARHTSVPEALQMVGCLINTVPLRVGVSPETEALELLRHLREINVATRPHEQASLVSMRSWADLPASTPLFETLVVFERYLMNSELQALGGAWAARHFSVLEQSDFALVLAAYQDGDDLILKLEHDAMRCEPDAVARLAEHVATLLRGIAKNPLAKVRELPLLSDAERDDLLAGAGGDGPLIPVHDITWPDAFASRARATPDAVALVSAHGETTYAGLDRVAA
ncbi:MAG: condensation domain-containing protein, partial [Myxococcota bacterium]|nr:condensation domain-containing protein [Myxococcota bacterium]